jgi:hypothetical protein
MKLTLSTIIGRDVGMIDGFLKHSKGYAGFDQLDCEKEIVVIVYRNSRIGTNITDEILDTISSYGARAVIYDEPAQNNFLENLYACQNMCYSEATDGWVLRVCSDEAYSLNSIPNLYDLAMRHREIEPKVLYNTNLIESPRAMVGGNISRHIIADFGDRFENLNTEAYTEFVNQINANVTEELLTVNDSIRYWGRPTTFRSTIKDVHNRTEGASWMITKQDWIDIGPMIPLSFGWITGDCYFHDKLELAGYKDYLTRDAVTYHFFQGERRGY